MVLLKLSNRKVSADVNAEGVLRGTLLLLMLAVAAVPATGRQRDTLGTGPRSHFVENRGQWQQGFRYKAQMHNAALFVEDSSITVALREKENHTAGDGHFHHAMSQRMHAYRVHFVGASQDVSIEGRDIDPNGGYDNYYYGQDPEKWVTRVPHCTTVYYRGLYDGIDMDIRVAEAAMKSNFYISPGSDPSVIAMRYDGAEKLYLSSGNLVVRTSVGEVVEMSPWAYQLIGGDTTEVPVRFRIWGDVVSLVVGEYDTKQPLVIDPVLHFSTYTGSTSDNWGTTATYDNHKNTYTAGLVFGTGYPVSTGAYDGTPNGNADIGIFKFDTSGTQRLFATYLGGSLADMPHSMFVNTFDELVIYGTTGSNDFPVTDGAYDMTFNGGSNLQFENTSTINFPNGSDIFVSRFSSDGSQLQASTYIGGSGNDGLNYHQRYNAGNIIMMGNDSLYFNYGDGARGELITDDMNNIYVGSTSLSSDFPITSIRAQRDVPQKQNGIVFKIDYNLRNMIWSTYLGGRNDDAVYSIDVDDEYNLLVCGGTNSPDFPTTEGSWQPTYGGGSADGFVAKISYNGESLMASTFVGSSEYDQLFFVRSGKHNEVFIFGQTKAQGSYWIHNANYNVPGSGMLLARLYPDLSGREWSTVFGTALGRPNLSPTAFAADICNRVYVAGWGRDFIGSGGIGWNQAGTTGLEITNDAYQSETDGQDFYIMSMSADASTLDYATFFGEVHGPNSNGGQDHVDGGTSRFDKMATLYQSVCASCYGNDGFPTTPNAWSTHNNSNNCNNALFRINIHNDFAVADFATPPVGCAPYTISFTNMGRGTSFMWDFGDGSTSTQSSPTHTYTQPGNYVVRLIATQESGCVMSDTTEHTVMVLDNRGRRITTETSCNGQPIQIGPQPMSGCSYSWIAGSVSDSTIANPYVTTGGIYVLRITAQQGCTEHDTFDVTYLSILDSLIIESPTCPGGDDGRVVAVVPADVSDSAVYYWDGVEGDSIMTGLSADGVRHTVVIESHGCRIERTFTLSDPPQMVIKKRVHDVLCSRECDGWIELVYGMPDESMNDTLLKDLCAGIYVIELNDPAGCPYYDTTEVRQDSNLLDMMAWADDSVLYLTESTRLHATEVPGASYSWLPSLSLDRPTSANPIATPVDTITVYGVTVTDSMGCTWYGEVPIRCTEVNCGRPNIHIPNAFSPNGDGINDRLCFRGEFVTDFYIAIYTRWGEKVYESHDINECWDGRYNDNWCMPGVYAYTCHVRCEAGFENDLKGDITILR